MPNPENLKPFNPGESGNPHGRPKGSRNLSTILKQMLTTEVEMDGERVQFQDAIIKKLLQKAQKGDIRAIQEIFDRVEGKPKQELEVGLESVKSYKIVPASGKGNSSK